MADYFSKLREGGFYWVQYSKLEISADGRTYNATEEVFGPEPAKFTGMSGGSPPRATWDFLGVASAVEDRQVRWAEPTEIVFHGA